MSIPSRHHYLPQFYLDRWIKDGCLWRFERPRGAQFPVHAKSVTPKSVAYERDLYALDGLENPVARQGIELKFFQIVDDRAARALGRLDSGVDDDPSDKLAICQFALSLLHRSPSRIDWLCDSLVKRMAADDPSHVEDQTSIRDAALEVLLDLIGSTEMVDFLMSLNMYCINIADGGWDLLISDRPVMVSNGIKEEDGFIMMPIGPMRLLIMCRREEIVEAFATQDHRALSRSINDAVVRQARHVVISTRKKPLRFVEDRFLVKGKMLETESGDGLVKWSVP